MSPHFTPHCCNYTIGYESSYLRIDSSIHKTGGRAKAKKHFVSWPAANLYRIQSIFIATFLLSLLAIRSSRLAAAGCPYRVDYLATVVGSSPLDPPSVSGPGRLLAPPAVQLLEDTFECDRRLVEALTDGNAAENSKGEPAPCEESDLDVGFYTHAVLPNGTNILPYVKFNMSVTTYVPLDRLFVQFRCVHAPDMEDKYCHDHSSQLARWGRMIWPCRALNLIDPGRKDAGNATADDRSLVNLSLPIRFSYNCFNLFGLSQYEVNITLLPKKCRSTHLLTIPTHRQLDPRIRDFFPRPASQKVHDDWSPLVHAEMSLPESIWLRINRPDISTVGSSQTTGAVVFSPIFLKVLERSDGGSRAGRLAATQRLAANETGFRWLNAPAGDYFLLAYAERFDCRLSCESIDGGVAPMAGGCRICPHTALNFTVPVDKFSPAHSRTIAVVALGKAFLVAVFVVLTFLVIALLLTILHVHVWRPRQLARRPAQSVEMTARPSVLIVYADDCEAHSAAVQALADLLAECANANVLLDQYALLDPNVRPSIWLLNAIAKAEYVLLIFSECSARVLKGEMMRQRRPFADLFVPAIGYVVAKINFLDNLAGAISPLRKKFDLRGQMARLFLDTEESLPFLFTTTANTMTGERQRQLSHFIAARFAYSPAEVVPEFFQADAFAGLCLPADLGLLVARLHGVLAFGDRATAGARFECADVDQSELNQRMADFEAVAAAHSHWADERFESEPAPDTFFWLNEYLERLAPCAVASDDLEATPEERMQLAAQYGLTASVGAGDSDDEEAPHQLPALTGRDDGGGKRIGPSDVSISESISWQRQRFELVGRLEDFHSSSSSLSSAR